MIHLVVFTAQQRLVVWPGSGDPLDHALGLEPNDAPRQVVLSHDRERALLVMNRRLVSIAAASGVVMEHRPPRPKPAFMNGDSQFHGAVATEQGWIVCTPTGARGLTPSLGTADLAVDLEEGSYVVHAHPTGVLVGGARCALIRHHAGQTTRFAALETDAALTLLAASEQRVCGWLSDGHVVSWASPEQPSLAPRLTDVLAIGCDDTATYLLCRNGKLVRAYRERLDVVSEWAQPLCAATEQHGIFYAADAEGHLVRITFDGRGKLLGLLPADAGPALSIGAS